MTLSKRCIKHFTEAGKVRWKIHYINAKGKKTSNTGYYMGNYFGWLEFSCTGRDTDPVWMVEPDRMIAVNKISEEGE